MSSGSSHKTSSLTTSAIVFFTTLMLAMSSRSYAIKMRFNLNVRVLMVAAEGIQTLTTIT